MMDFVLMTLSFTMAILLASALTCVIMFNGKVFKMIMKLYIKRIKSVQGDFEDLLDII